MRVAAYVVLAVCSSACAGVVSETEHDVQIRTCGELPLVRTFDSRAGEPGIAHWEQRSAAGTTCYLARSAAGAPGFVYLQSGTLAEGEALITIESVAVGRVTSSIGLANGKPVFATSGDEQLVAREHRALMWDLNGPGDDLATVQQGLNEEQLQGDWGDCRAALKAALRAGWDAATSCGLLTVAKAIEALIFGADFISSKSAVDALKVYLEELLTELASSPIQCGVAAGKLSWELPKVGIACIFLSPWGCPNCHPPSGGGSPPPTGGSGGSNTVCTDCKCTGQFNSFEGQVCGTSTDQLIQACWNSCF